MMNYINNEKYDTYMNQISIARKSYYVFSKNQNTQKNELIIERINLTKPEILNFSN
jgi:hypothetical protein